MCAKSLVTFCWPSSKTICSARSTRSETSPSPLLPEAHDLLTRADEPAQRRHLLDDARVVLDVRRGGTSAASSATRAWPPAPSSSARSSSSFTSVIASTGSPFDHSASAAR